jgi:hypothetical protein
MKTKINLKKSLVFSLLFLVFLTSSRSILAKSPDFNLPNPGMLADNPLIFLKNIKEDIIIFAVRDNEKKAKYYLSLSQRHLSGALILHEKGRADLAIDELRKSENDFLQSLTTANDILKTGGSISDDLLEDMKRLSISHKEVLNYVLSNSKNTNTVQIAESIDVNVKLQIQIDDLR